MPGISKGVAVADNRLGYPRRGTTSMLIAVATIIYWYTEAKRRLHTKKSISSSTLPKNAYLEFWPANLWSLVATLLPCGMLQVSVGRQIVLIATQNENVRELLTWPKQTEIKKKTQLMVWCPKSLGIAWTVSSSCPGHGAATLMGTIECLAFINPISQLISNDFCSIFKLIYPTGKTFEIPVAISPSIHPSRRLPKSKSKSIAKAISISMSIAIFITNLHFAASSVQLPAPISVSIFISVSSV